MITCFDLQLGIGRKIEIQLSTDFTDDARKSSVVNNASNVPSKL